MNKHAICLGLSWTRLNPETNRPYCELLKEDLDSIADFQYEFSPYYKKIANINFDENDAKKTIKQLKCAMEGSDCLLLLYNSDYYTNPWYQYEIEAACELNVFVLTIIPREYEGTPGAKLSDDPGYAFMRLDAREIASRIDLWDPLENKEKRKSNNKVYIKHLK